MINYNILALLGPGDIVTVQTKEQFTAETIQSLRQIEAGGHIQIMTRDSEMKTSIYNRCQFKIASGFLASRFIEKFGHKLSELTVVQTDKSASSANSNS